MPIERITQAQLHAEMKAQGVTNERHIAFICVVCGTIQSVASLIKAGATEDQAKRAIGFACEGRFRNAGPWPRGSDKGPRARARRKVRGCDWTLGGLFRIHEREVEMPDGTVHPTFRLASPQAAQQLQTEMEAA